MPGIGVISNRNARLNRMHPELKDQLAYVIGDNGKVASTGSLPDARRAAETFRRLDIDIIAISGGDGTAHRTIEVLLDVYGDRPLPPLLLLPTGTQNMVPRSFDIDGSGLANLMLATLRYRHNIPMVCIRRNLLRVNGHVSFMFGMGVAARFMFDYYAEDPTPKGAASLLTRLVASAAAGTDLAKRLLAAVPARISVDGSPLNDGNPLPINIFFASFIERLPLHFVLFPHSGREPGKFEIAYCADNPLYIAAAFPRILQGYEGQLHKVPRCTAERVSIDIDTPEMFTLDGEMYGPESHFEIESGPELQFVVPGLGTAALKNSQRYSQTGPWNMRFLI